MGTKLIMVDPNITANLLNLVWIIIGLVAIYAGIFNLKDKENPSRIGTAVFWCSFGLVCGLGTWLPPKVSGALVILMCIPAVFKRVKVGDTNGPTKEETERQYAKIGNKIFLPALMVAVSSLLFAIFTNISTMIGITVGVIISIIMLKCYDSKENTAKVFLDDSERFLSLMGPLCMLPQLLGSLGGIFAKAGVGDVVAQIVGKFVEAGNVNVGIIVFAIGMALFTMIMGNAFAAITVMTVGIGAPFVLAYGADPVVIGMIALTSGYCGTLCTPMAANFNIVPVAILNMDDKWGVIKKQIPIAIILLIVQICYMIILK